MLGYDGGGYWMDDKMVGWNEELRGGMSCVKENGFDELWGV